jgi:hypothetical protein
MSLSFRMRFASATWAALARMDHLGSIGQFVTLLVDACTLRQQTT